MSEAVASTKRSGGGRAAKRLPKAGGRSRPAAAVPIRKRRTHEERREATRAALLAAAVEVIAEVGFASATTSMIADRAGVTRGALQYHFESRDEMVLAVIDEVMAELNFRLDTSDLAKASLGDRVEALVARYRSVFSGPMFLAVMQIILAVRSDEILFARVRMHLEQAQQAINQTWHEIFPDVDLTNVGMAGLRRITMAAIRGYVLLEAFGVPGAWPRDSKLLAKMVERELHSPS